MTRWEGTHCCRDTNSLVNQVGDVEWDEAVFHVLSDSSAVRRLGKLGILARALV